MGYATELLVEVAHNFGELVRVILPPALVSKRSAPGETLQPGRLLASGAEGLRRPSHTQSRYEREPSWPAGTGAQVNRFWSSGWSCGLSACDEFGEGTGLEGLVTLWRALFVGLGSWPCPA